MSAFQPSREDGRSDKRVVYELTHAAVSDTVFTHGDIQAALEAGVDRDITRARISQAVASANKMLLREHSRYLTTIPGVGYRMIRAEEHLPVALGKKARAETQIQHGIDLLKNTDLSELTETQRTVHLGHTMILEGVWRMAKASEKRQAEQQRAINEMLQKQTEIADRLTRLEGDGGDDGEGVAALAA